VRVRVPSPVPYSKLKFPGVKILKKKHLKGANHERMEDLV
jgi:hypothetical protein